MYKLHSKSSFSLLFVAFLLFATQFFPAKQLSTTTSFRHPISERLLTSSYNITCSNSCHDKESLTTSETNYQLILNPNSQATLEFDYVQSKQITIFFDVDLNQPVDFTVDVWSSDLMNETPAIQAVFRSNPVPITLIPSDKNELFISVSNSNPNNFAIANVKITYLDKQIAQGAPGWVVPLGGIAGSLIFLVILASIACLRYSGNRRPQARHSQVPVFVEQMKAQPSSVKAAIDSHFPETKFENLKSSFPQKTCSICLEDLQESELCRQLECQHIFHSECGKLWLENQFFKKNMATCPNCNHQVLTINLKK